MNLSKFIRNSEQRIREDGFRGAIHSGRLGYYKLLHLSDPLFDSGTSIFEEEWDLLIVLDACRLDLMEEVGSEFDFVNEIDRRRSLNSATARWMEDTFGPTSEYQLKQTGYVCGNPFSKTHLDEGSFAEVNHVWRHAWTNPGTVPPEAVTDTTIRMGRDNDYQRVIAHYMQPHAPFISNPNLGPGKDLNHFGNQPQGDVWDQLREGTVHRDDIWEAYADNLRLGMQEVDRLLSNFVADRAIITSDHGNALGEWGVYGHRGDIPLECLRTVPWISTQAVDRGESDPNKLEDELNIDREDQLESLGYL